MPGRVVRRIGHIWGDLTATYCEISCGNAITRNLMREARSPGEISPQYGLRLRLDRLPNVSSHTVHTDSPSAETTRQRIVLGISHLVAGITHPSRCFHQLRRLSSNLCESGLSSKAGRVPYEPIQPASCQPPAGPHRHAHVTPCCYPRLYTSHALPDPPPHLTAPHLPTRLGCSLNRLVNPTGPPPASLLLYTRPPAACSRLLLRCALIERAPLWQLGRHLRAPGYNVVYRKMAGAPARTPWG